jgi:outer membrane protein OmpA-like peptidoglycan-associated protein
MKTRSFRFALVAAVVSAGGLGLTACAGPMWIASHGDVQEHVSREGARAQTAEAQLGDRVTAADQVAHDASAKADAVAVAAKHPYQYQVLLQDDSVKFASNSAKLSAEAQNRLTELAAKLQSEDKNVYIEIQGHGDSRGSVAHNKALGERRAQAVREFLADKGVPLPRMSTISYGEEKPKTAEQNPGGNAENRRVMLVVMG